MSAEERNLIKIILHILLCENQITAEEQLRVLELLGKEKQAADEEFY